MFALGVCVWASWLEPLHRQLRAQHAQPADPGMGPLALPIVAIVVLTLVWAIRRRVRGDTLRGVRTFVFGAAIGNALLELGGVFIPDRPNAECIERLEQAPIIDAVGDARPPGHMTPPPRSRVPLAALASPRTLDR